MELTNAGPELSASNAFLLTHIDLYNWGGFSERWDAKIDAHGTAIIGPTGSGKTTLVDALMTLLTANPRYNLASTGGHESDRDLVSYIRGVCGPGNNSGDNDHIARSGKTLTGIAARFSNGSAALCLGALFWFEGSSSAATDLNRRWIFSQAPGQGLDLWLAAYHNGGTRELKQMGRDIAGLSVDESKQAYLAKLRHFFEIGENAFTLLNRAAGLKQLNSIDEIFRELVLDDNAKFGRAGEVAKEFDDLAAIHTELDIARNQQRSLLPIADSWHQHQSCVQALSLQLDVRTLLPIWYAEYAYRLWGERMAVLAAEQIRKQQEISRLSNAITTQSEHADALHAVYLHSGGGDIEALRAQLATQTQYAQRCARDATDYLRLVHKLALATGLDAETLGANQALAAQRESQQQITYQQQQETAYQQGVIEQRHSEELRTLEADLTLAQRCPHSNIPHDYHRFRAELAQQLALDEDDLPFLAELVEVKAEEQHWRGAIERAIGGHRLRILVPVAQMSAALRWVNQRHNQLHVRLQELRLPAAAANFLADGFSRKLNFKTHAYREAVKYLIAGSDRHCVKSPEQLQGIAHALTEQGLMSGANGFFEKQDQRRLNENWCTGFDNRDRMAALRAQLADAKTALAQSTGRHRHARDLAETTGHQLSLLKQLLTVSFSNIDQPGADRLVQQLQERLELLTRPDSSTSKAQAQWLEARHALRELDDQRRNFDKSLSSLSTEYKHAEENRQRAFRRLGAGLTGPQRQLAEQNLTPVDPDQLNDLEALERSAAEVIDREIKQHGDRRTALEKDLVRAMEKAQKEDTGALVNVGTDIEDIPAYLLRLKTLSEEALPEKLHRFIDYLNQSSDQGVTQLLSDIDNEVSVIEERIDDLNNTLLRVDFQPGHYLRLVPQRISHESLQTLQTAQRHLRSAALKDDQGESHFKALRHMVALLREASERRKMVGNLALLDPRYRLQFTVSVIERGTGATIASFKGSQGGSGGEKEIIASYVLTASLSYALCPAGSRKPLFASIVLDEAFSKSSHVVASRIISALNEFGLHPLFVTPNKEMRLLRTHTRSAILVHRKGQQATLTSLSWEELETIAKQHQSELGRQPDLSP